MLEVVAVEDVLAPVAIKAGDHTHYLTGWHVHGVLPARVLGWWPTTVAGEHLEVDQVEVNRVVHIRGKLPDLGRAQLGASVDARGVEHLAVDGPHYLTVRRSPGEIEIAPEPSV